MNFILQYGETIFTIIGVLSGIVGGMYKIIDWIITVKENQHAILDNQEELKNKIDNEILTKVSENNLLLKEGEEGYRG